MRDIIGSSGCFASRVAGVCASIAIFAVLSGNAFATDSDTAKTPSTAVAAPVSAQPDTSSFRLTGFRSAQFGASESEVRFAIAKDFLLSSAAIHKSQNPADRTTILSARVPNVLADGGTAEVAYIFGYQTKKLTQVNVLWSAQTDKSLTAERLVANGEALKAYFDSQGYVSIVSNSPVRDGILLFRGTDINGRMTALMLHGSLSAGSDKTKTFTPNALLLFYLASPKSPDVFKIQSGKF
jgi:hypothetical protein